MTTRPLGEGALAEVLEAQRLLGAAALRLDASLGAMQQARVPIDETTFRRVYDVLDQAYAHVGEIVLSHLDALDAQSKPK